MAGAVLAKAGRQLCRLLCALIPAIPIIGRRLRKRPLTDPAATYSYQTESFSFLLIRDAQQQSGATPIDHSRERMRCKPPLRCLPSRDQKF